MKTYEKIRRPPLWGPQAVRYNAQKPNKFIWNLCQRTSSHTVHGGYFQSEPLHLREGTRTSRKTLIIRKNANIWKIRGSQNFLKNIQNPEKRWHLKNRASQDFQQNVNNPEKCQNWKIQPHLQNNDNSDNNTNDNNKDNNHNSKSYKKCKIR